MNRKKHVLLLSLVFVCLLASAYLLYNTLSGQADSPQMSVQEESTSSQESASADKQPIPAPDFTVYDAEGNEVHLSDFQGKPVILNFWASWCGPCQSEMPAFDEAYAAYGDKVHFLMVNMTDGSQETLESALDFVANSGYLFPVYYDTQMSAAAAYGVYSLPTTYFIDADGYGVAYISGPASMEMLEQGIGMVLE